MSLRPLVLTLVGLAEICVKSNSSSAYTVLEISLNMENTHHMTFLVEEIN